MKHSKIFFKQKITCSIPLSGYRNSCFCWYTQHSRSSFYVKCLEIHKLPTCLVPKNSKEYLKISYWFISYLLWGGYDNFGVGMRNLEFLFAIFENKISSGLIIMIDKRKWHVDFCLVSLAFYLLSVTCGLNANILVDFSVKNT